MPFTERPG